MAHLSLTLPILCIILLLTYSAGGDLKLANGEIEKTWCVARPSTPESQLMENWQYACREVNCAGLFEEGCPCHYPDTFMNRASVAMNLYYQAKGKNWWNCEFKGSGLLVITDPSYGSCTYAYESA